MFAATSSVFRPRMAAAGRTTTPNSVGVLFQRANAMAMAQVSCQCAQAPSAARAFSLSSAGLAARVLARGEPRPMSKRRPAAPTPLLPAVSGALSRAISTTAPAARVAPAASRDATRDATAAEAVSKAQMAAHADLPPLDWNTFFQLRKTRRRIQLGFSVLGGLTGSMAGGLFLSAGVAEPLMAQVPLDPVLSLGLMTFAFAALGWLAGPSVGNLVFYAWKRQYRAQMTLKETQFFARIKKNRVDPSASSAGNPVPDFYGEKISSVAGYRQWLKDQRAFNKKRVTFV